MEPGSVSSIQGGVPFHNFLRRGFLGCRTAVAVLGSDKVNERKQTIQVPFLALERDVVHRHPPIDGFCRDFFTRLLRFLFFCYSTSRLFGVYVLIDLVAICLRYAIVQIILNLAYSHTLYVVQELFLAK